MATKYQVLMGTLGIGAALLCSPCAMAADGEAIALKAGETQDMGNLFWVAGCKSLLVGPITAEILDGPAGVTVTINQQKVIPRKLNCANEVPGGRLIVHAPDEVKEKTQGSLIVRMKYPTKDGERQQARTISVTLVP
jgi:hypothetical protein